MVKAVVGEETQLKLAEERLFQSNIHAQIGLVIGKLNPNIDRGFVFDLVPTPPNDIGEPACSVLGISNKDDKKKSLSKGKSQAESTSLVIDSDWIAEHARQVSRLLLGGMSVVGVYIWATESLFKNSTVILWQTVKGVAEAAPILENDLDERLLIHISYSPRRWTCRNCTLGSSNISNSLWPCDFKMGRILASLQTFRCIYNFEIRIPILSEYATKGNTLRDILLKGILYHAQELKGAKAMVDGSLVVEDQPCTSDSIHEVELLLPFMNNSSAEVCSQNEVVGAAIFSGCICSYSYLSPKEPLSQAIADMKGDIIMSLQNRLDIICDDVEGDLDSTIDVSTVESNEISTEKPIPLLVLQLLREPCALSLPRRILVPWLANVCICDYLQPSETFEVVKDHCKELMSMESPDTSRILEPEREAISLTTGSFWDVVQSVSQSTTTESERDLNLEGGSKEPLKQTTRSTVISILILLLAILVGLVYFGLDRKNSVQ